MTTRVLFLSLAVISSHCFADAPADSGQPLFDGKSLNGWQSVGDASWRVIDGTIRTDGEKRGFLMTEREFADFQLHVEYKSPAATNSGIFLRTQLDPKDPMNDCYELNIAPADTPFPTGSFVERKRCSQAANVPARPGQWHSLDAAAEGGRFTVHIDGNLVNQYVDPEAIVRGRIGLQSNSGEVAFRNIRIHVLPCE
jgi:hypothetical protein